MVEEEVIEDEEIKEETQEQPIEQTNSLYYDLINTINKHSAFHSPTEIIGTLELIKTQLMLRG